MPDNGFNGAISGRNVMASRRGSAIDIADVADMGMIDIRIPPQGRATINKVSKELGLDLPTTPRTSASARGRTALWWSIDQWIITCPASSTANLVKKLEKALGASHAMITDVSDARCIIRIAGDTARGVLMKGSSVDFRSPDVVPGHVRRTQLAEIPVAVHCTGNGPDSFEIFVFRSYADYMWQWLVAAGRANAKVELFGAQPTPPV